MNTENVMSPSVQFYTRDEWDKMTHLQFDGCIYELPKGVISDNQEDLIMVVKENIGCSDYSVSIKTIGNGGVSYNDGEIFKNGTVIYSVMEGESGSVQIFPDDGNCVKSLVVNGIDVTETMPEIFDIDEISNDIVIVVTFEEIITTTYSLEVSAMGNGTVKCNGAAIKENAQVFDFLEGTKVVLEFIPDEDNIIGNIMLNGEDITEQIEDGKYVIEYMEKDVALATTFNLSPSGFPVPKYVDMGCSVCWADWDVGATDSSEYGLYYGWGALTDADGDYAKGFDGESIAGTEYDVAKAKWGDGWRMPTFADFEELFSKCRAPERVRNGNISGYRLTSKYTKNSIFLPAAGYASKDKYAEVGRYLYFWAADIDPEGVNPILCRFTASGPVSRPNNPRLRAIVRAVYDKKAADPEVEPATEEAGKPIDLGLSVKWSDINFGAKEETEAGRYIAWADLGEPKDLDYSKSAHTYYKDGKYEYLGKDFNAGNNYKYDIARKNWKGTWRVPTQSEMSELWMKCNWQWIKKDGINGFNITGTNGKTIFLPATGWKTGPNDKDQLKQYNNYCGYWTSSLNLRNTDYGLNLMANKETEIPMPGTYREFGLNIRPVCE